MVKNAVIVPVGSKGGFVVKRPPAAIARRCWRRASPATGSSCAGCSTSPTTTSADEVVPPPGWSATTRMTRTWWWPPTRARRASPTSPTRSSAEYGFWLGDAFASGGSHGYDHKKMGITARGAWESVKRHFRELGIDIQREDFTVVGIGDMSGDVFGNGMLLLAPHPAGGGLQPPAYIPGPRPRPDGELRRAPAPVRPAALGVERLRPSVDLRGWRRACPQREIDRDQSPGAGRAGDRRPIG